MSGYRSKSRHPKIEDFLKLTDFDMLVGESCGRG